MSTCSLAERREANRGSDGFVVCRQLINTKEPLQFYTEFRRKISTLFRDLRPLYLENGYWRLDDLRNYTFNYSKRFAAALPPEAQDWAFSRIAHFIAQVNPQKAAAMETLIDADQSLDVFLRNLTSGLAASDIPAALKITKRIQVPHQRNFPYVLIAENLANAPVETFKEILDLFIADAEVSLEHKRFVLTHTHGNHCQAVFDGALKLPDSPEKTAVLSYAVCDFRDSNPAKAIDRLEKLSKTEQQKKLPYLVSNMAPIDPKAAEALAGRLEDLGEREQWLGFVAAYMLDTDSARAFALIASIKGQYNYTVGNFLKKLGNIDLPKALQLARAAKDPDLCITCIAEGLNDLSEAEKLLEAPEIKYTLLRDRILRAIAEKLIPTDPEKARLIINQMKELSAYPAKHALARSYVKVSAQCAQKGDLPGAEAALMQIKSNDHNLFEQTLVALAPLIGKSYPHEISRMAGMLSPSERKQFVTAAALCVAETDLEKAMQLLKSASLHKSELSDFVAALAQKDLLLGFRAAKYIEDDTTYAITIAQIGAECKFVPRPPSDQVVVGYADLVKPLPPS